jgi:DNA polymerase (family 10)
MTKEEIAGALEQIATLLELKNENPFKIWAYTNAARAIETFGGNVTNFGDEEALSKIPGIGRASPLRSTNSPRLDR